MFPKPEKRQRDKSPYNSLRGPKKPKKPQPAWKEGLLSHHKTSAELEKEDGHISKAKVRKAVIERDKGNWCSICGVPGPGLHLHRVIYGSQGGKYEVDNCILLCAEHHDIVHSNKRVWQPLLLNYLKASDVNKPLIGGKPIRDLGYGFFDD